MIIINNRYNELFIIMILLYKNSNCSSLQYITYHYITYHHSILYIITLRITVLLEYITYHYITYYYNILCIITLRIITVYYVSPTLNPCLIWSFSSKSFKSVMNKLCWIAFTSTWKTNTLSSIHLQHSSTKSNSFYSKQWRSMTMNKE